MSDLFLCAAPFRGVGQQAAPVGLHAVGDPHLRAVDDVVVAVLLGAGLEGCHVGAAPGFADPDAAHHVAGDCRRQELLAQRVRSKARQRRCAHVGLHADGHGNAADIAVAQRLGHHHRVAEVQAHAAEFGGVLDAQQAQVAQLLEQLMGGNCPAFSHSLVKGLISLATNLRTVSEIWLCSDVNFMKGFRSTGKKVEKGGAAGERVTCGPRQRHWIEAGAPAPRLQWPGTCRAGGACRADR
jgi:hypothetical protein